MPIQTPYTGTERKLVFAFDVGTTYSGISYTILDPGREPEIKPVTRFPSRSQVGGDAKVPTVIYYDSHGVPQAIGAETESEGLDAIAEESQWVKVEWFKLHLRPRTQTTASISEEIPPLPTGKTVVRVLADFLNYLNKCARSYIEETHLDGTSLLSSGKVEFILSHPNAWEGAQQTLMRDAAIQAGLVADTPEGRRRISFISEGEASLNFCIDKNLTNASIQRGDGVAIVDAGGGTIDVSTYSLRQNSVHEYEEIVAAQCYFKGSVFVTRAAHKYLKDLLLNTRYRDDVAYMADRFDKTNKLAFRDSTDPQYIKFGSARDRDPSLGIRAGQLKLDGGVIASFFEPSIQCIVDAIKEQQRLSSKRISTVFLVGGFAASDYLFKRVQENLAGLIVRRPDAHLNKAVPDGALVGYLCPTVRSRVAKHSYGVRADPTYDYSNVEHRRRSNKCYRFLSGELALPGGFSAVLDKGTQVLETQEFRRSFYFEKTQKSGFSRETKIYITSYRGQLSSPEFVDQDPENFYDVFEVRGDLSRVIGYLRPSIGSEGNRYFRIDFDVIILFGANEFKAQIAWKENGTEKRGPAEICFDTDIVYQN